MYDAQGTLAANNYQPQPLIKGRAAAAQDADVANDVCGAGAAVGDGNRFRDMSICRLTVVQSCFWEAILAMKKFVEFRSPRQPIQFFAGLCLLFSLNATERRNGRTDLIGAVVLEIVMLSCDEAYARFPREAQGCNLKSRCAKWGSKTIQCLVLDPNSIGVQRPKIFNTSQWEIMVW